MLIAIALMLLLAAYLVIASALAGKSIQQFVQDTLGGK